MAPQHVSRPNTLRLSALALAALSLTPMSNPVAAQTIYREYEDGTVEALPDGDDRHLSTAPLRRPPPRAYDEDDDERFERDDDEEDDDVDDDQDGDDRQGILDVAPDRSGVNRSAQDRKAPTPPPSIDAKPGQDAWKPAL